MALKGASPGKVKFGEATVVVEEGEPASAVLLKTATRRPVGGATRGSSSGGGANCVRIRSIK